MEQNGENLLRNCPSRKPEKSISSSADISKIQPRGGFLPLTLPVLPAPPALPVLPLFLSQSCQVTIMNKTNSKLPDQQTIFDQLGGVLLNYQNMKLQLKPKLQHYEKYSKPFSNIIIVPTRITRNRNKNHEVKYKQDKESVLSVSAISSDSSSARLIKPEPNSDEDIANGVKPSSISSKGSVPSKNLNGRIRKKHKSQGMTIKSDVCTRSRRVLNEILSKPKSAVPPDSFISQIKKEPPSPENSSEETIYFENHDDDSLSEATNFCKDLNQPVSKEQSEQYPGIKDRISEAERGYAIGRLLIPKTEIVESCTGLFQSTAFDSNCKSPIPNRNSTSLESGFPAEDASFSLFLEGENHGKKYQTNSALPVIENIYSAKTPADLKLDEQLESFGNFVSASLRSLPPKSRNRIMFRICNVLMNPNI
ncbi:hypothetical protein AVEN_43658-2 [Araneus ventricosus]|uniref:BESS domain-containing protein n=1 Tax=Araneus ventricosus TaxID=182803 RepID=A0A4Y2SGY4_ARAVE|nr:hypothetical protein AVEN_43658-2 [Araneus ventricosus]